MKHTLLALTLAAATVPFTFAGQAPSSTTTQDKTTTTTSQKPKKVKKVKKAKTNPASTTAPQK